MPSFCQLLQVLSPCLCLTSSFLLIGYRAPPRTLAGARVGVGALAVNRQAAAMTQAAVGSHFDQALDVHRSFFAQIAFDRAFGFENGSDLVDLFLCEVGDLGVRIDTGAIAERVRPGPSNAVNVGQTDLGPF